VQTCKVPLICEMSFANLLDEGRKEKLDRELRIQSERSSRIVIVYVAIISLCCDANGSSLMGKRQAGKSTVYLRCRQLVITSSLR
jgi:hypothetical protein